MSTQTKKEVLAKLRSRYAHAGSPYKSKLNDQLIELFDLHSQSAIRSLRRAPRPSGPTVRFGRPRQYRPDLQRAILMPIWLACQ